MKLTRQPPKTLVLGLASLMAIGASAPLTSEPQPVGSSEESLISNADPRLELMRPSLLPIEPPTPPDAPEPTLPTTLSTTSGAFILTQITDTPAGKLTWPHDFSADGRYLLLTSIADLVPPQNTDGSREIFLYDRLTGTFEQLTDITLSDFTYGLGMSADATKVALVSTLDLDESGDTDGTAELFLLDRTSGIPQRITDGPYSVYASDFSKIISGDGTRIVFVSDKDLEPAVGNAEHGQEVFLYDVPSATFRQLSNSNNDGSDWSGSVKISRDGTTVTFASRSNDFLNNPERSTELVRIILATGQMYVTTTAYCPWPSGSTRCTTLPASISHDGKKITFRSTADLDDSPISNSDGNYELFLLGPVWPGVDRIGQQTQVSGAPPLSIGPHSLHSASDRNATRIAFLSNADYGQNGDGNWELFLLNPTPPHPLVGPRQITDSTAAVDLFQMDVRISDDGGLILFTSTLDWDPSVGNADGSREVFIARPINPPPLLNPIGEKTGVVGRLLSFAVQATDPDNDNDPLSFYALDVPTSLGATFTENGDGTATFSWPEPVEGSQFVTVVVQDDDTIQDAQDAGTSWSDSESITIRIVPNQAPVLDSISNQAIGEGSTLAFSVTASDSNNDPLTFSADNLPAGANFDSTSAIFSWTPGCAQAGTYPGVSFTVSDGLATDSEAITMTVTNALNCPPVLNPIGDRTVAEGEALSVAVSASDPEGDSLSLTTSLLPTGATFTDQTDGTGTLSWTPDYTQAGPYSVTFSVTDGSASESETIILTVTNTNRAPTANPQTVTTEEDTAVALTLTGSDPDGEALSYAVGTPPTNGSLTGTPPMLTYTPALNYHGSDSFTFTVSDGMATSSPATVLVTISSVNDAPVLNSVGDRTVAEADVLNITLSATDGDGDTLTYDVTNRPTGSSFDPATRTFSWTPDYTQAGSYAGVHFEVTDGQGGVDLEDTTITVTNTNQPPTAADQNLTTDEDTALAITLSGSDPDGETLSYALATPPTQGTLAGTPPSVTYTPNPNYTGADSFTFTVSDGTASSAPATVSLTITPVNDAPVLAPIADRTVAEGEALSVAVSASDPEGDSLSLTTSLLPTGATFTDQTDGTGTLSWTPDYTQAGPYSVTFTVSDGTATESKASTLTVTNTNRPPILLPVGAKNVAEGQLLSFVVTATEPDGEVVTLSAANLPMGASFTDNGDGTGQFTWTPSFEQAGSYPDVMFQVTDGSMGTSEAVLLSVDNTNRPPELAWISHRTAYAGYRVSFRIQATDPDGDSMSYSASNLPSGATFDQVTQTFSWIPTYSQIGPHQVTFTVTDLPGVSDSQVVSISVVKKLGGGGGMPRRLPVE